MKVKEKTKWYYCENCGEKTIEAVSRISAKLGIITKYFNCNECYHRPNPNVLPNIKPNKK